jgi:nucleotide-binding universal stress UspA family protein
MKTILVPLDGSVNAERVLPYVRLLAPTLGARVLLLRIVSEAEIGFALLDDALAISGAGKPEEPRDLARRSWELLQRHAESYLNSVAVPLRIDGIDVAIDIRSGAAADGIVEAAESEHVAMIAMATHGYGGLKRWALGSVTDKISHAASVPVFIVRGHAPPPPHLALERIMVPLDGSPLARQALPLAVELATCARAELLLLTVVTPALGDAPPAFDAPPTAGTLQRVRAELARELGDVGPQLRREGIPVTPLVEEGAPADVIIEEAARHRADLLVMATHGYSGLKRWALGSVADKVLHASTTPLLLVRARSGT